MLFLLINIYALKLVEKLFISLLIKRSANAGFFQFLVTDSRLTVRQHVF